MFKEKVKYQIIKVIKKFHLLDSRKKIILFSVIGILLISIFLIRNSANKKRSEAPKEKFLRAISIAKLENKNIDVKLSFLGKLYPKSEFKVSADIQGGAIVYDILFHEGDSVTKNQILMTLDQTFTQNEFFNLYKVRSQHNGVISDVFVDVGTKVTAGVPLFNIVDIHELKVIIDIPEKYLDKIKKDQKAIISLRGDSDTKKNGFIGKINYLNPVSSFQKGKNNQAVIILDNSDLKLKSGFFVDVEVIVGKSNLFLLPLSSVIFESNSYAVYIYDPLKESVFLKEIKVGNLFDNTFIEVLEGLKENDFFLTIGQSFVFNGEKVRVNNIKSFEGIQN